MASYVSKDGKWRVQTVTKPRLDGKHAYSEQRIRLCYAECVLPKDVPAVYPGNPFGRCLSVRMVMGWHVGDFTDVSGIARYVNLKDLDPAEAES